MEIEWGNLYFSCEKSVAILLVAAPVVLAMEVPTVIRGLRRLVSLIKRRSKKQYPYT